MKAECCCKTVSMTPVELSQLACLVADELEKRLSTRSVGDAWVNVREAAEILGVSIPTVERRTREGIIPSEKLGRLRRYKRSVLLALSEDRSGDE